jgi:Zn-finger nucleic acid-binding protein
MEMNCPNCGAPMNLAPDKLYFVCPYCTSIYFPEKGPDGLRILNIPSELNCPVCNIPLLSAWAGDTHVLCCGKCRGLLLNQLVFLYTIQYLRANSSNPPLRPTPMNPEELKRQIECPKCHQKMDTHPYGGPGNIVVDNCPECNLIWLDYRELDRVVSAPGDDRGQWV